MNAESCTAVSASPHWNELVAPMHVNSPARLQWVVFAVVCAAFSNIYVTQPILPILEAEFAADTVRAAQTVSAVLLGISLANLPFGYLSDRYSIRPLLLCGGAAIALAGLVCALTDSLNVLIAARFVQGLFIPALTTCLAAYLAKTLPSEQLNVAMGSYVAATVLGGMGGRLLGGFIHDPGQWRSAFISAAVAVFAASLIGSRLLPEIPATRASAGPKVSYASLLMRRELVVLYLCGAAGQAIFSPVFNTFPYRLASAPFHLSSQQTTAVYLVYLAGVFMAPASGRLSNRLGNGNTLILGALFLAGALCLLLVPSLIATLLALLGICAGFFTVHAAAVGALNRKLTGGQGRANALYILAYYLGAWFGVSWSAWVYQRFGWSELVVIAILLTSIPLVVGDSERRRSI